MYVFGVRDLQVDPTSGKASSGGREEAVITSA